MHSTVFWFLKKKNNARNQEQEIREILDITSAEYHAHSLIGKISLFLLDSMDSLRKKPRHKPLAAGRYIPVSSAQATPPFLGPREQIFAFPPARISQSKRTLSRKLARVILTIGLLLLCLFGYFSWKVGQATRLLDPTPSASTPFADTLSGAGSLISPLTEREQFPLLGESEGRTNILLLGKSNEHTAGQHLTDTIMVASLDFERKKIALLSLPRDLYVTLPELNLSAKINSLYQYDVKNNTGADTIKVAVSEITNLPIHYFAVVDYDGFSGVVDALGGVSVYVERDLFDPRFPGPNYSYETFDIKRGWHTLDGKTALKYVRERHADPEGDFGRAKRQHDVLLALRNKAFSLKILLNPLAIGNVIESLSEHIRTDLSPKEMRSLVARAEEFDTKNISTAVLDAWKKTSLLRVSHIPVGPIAMFILLPRTGNWSETRELAENIFDIEKIEERKRLIVEESATIVLRNQSGIPSAGKRLQTLLLEDLGMKKVKLSDDTPKNVIMDTQLRASTGTESITTLDELAQKFSIRNIERKDFTRTEDGDTDIVITIGKDLAQRLSFEENSPDDIRRSENDVEYQKKIHDLLAPSNL
ncbi:MAG: LCP family protein [Candidatus Moraniibacteriota bacterium]|nr:MAG: LCP family protein [Candidatus Moranbacteria bacterium]